MSSSIVTAKVKCSTCLYITDHVVLKCGHNVCRDCNDCVLDPQDKSGTYSCPQCSETTKKCPFLLKNRRFHNIMKIFRSPQPDRDKKVCTFCIHSRVLAVKCCLHCAAYLCNDHLKAHIKSPEHVLCDPNISLEKRRCPDHSEQLKLYCIDDADCICITCRLVGDHRGHQVESLEVASKAKKEKLSNVLQKLMIKQEEMEERVQSLQERRRKVQGKAANETERVTALITDLRRRLENLEKRVLSDISGQAERISMSVLEMIQEMEIKKDELSRKMRHIEELCNMTDPLTVLQESDTGDLCDTEDGDDEDRERHDKLLHDGEDLDVDGVSHTLHTGLSDILSGVNVQKYPGTHVFPHSSTKDKVPITVEVFRSIALPNPTTQHSYSPSGGPNIGAAQQTSEQWGQTSEQWGQTSEQWGATDILLDVSTAGNYLRISDDKKTASWSGIYCNRPDTSKRFNGYPQVLSDQSFSSGRHSWEVDVEESDVWIVGVCYPSIDRRGEQSRIGYNKKSWGLERWENQYSVILDSNKIPLPGNISSSRIRIYVDYEAGQISFYVCDPIRRLHTFTTTFTEPLHAVLGVGDGYIEIAGGIQM